MKDHCQRLPVVDPAAKHKNKDHGKCGHERSQNKQTDSTLDDGAGTLDRVFQLGHLIGTHFFNGLWWWCEWRRHLRDLLRHVLYDSLRRNPLHKRKGIDRAED